MFECQLKILQEKIYSFVILMKNIQKKKKQSKKK
jgi:hypothetical protein